MNLWQQFQKLLPSDVLVAGVIESSADGVYVIALPTGGRIPARSVTSFTTGSNVFVKGGQITGEAPNLGSITTIEV